MITRDQTPVDSVRLHYAKKFEQKFQAEIASNILSTGQKRNLKKQQPQVILHVSLSKPRAEYHNYCNIIDLEKLCFLSAYEAKIFST